MENTIRINPERLYTKSEYHRKTGMSRMTIDKKITDKELKTLKVKGAILIID